MSSQKSRGPLSLSRKNLQTAPILTFTILFNHSHSEHVVETSLEQNQILSCVSVASVHSNKSCSAIGANTFQELLTSKEYSLSTSPRWKVVSLYWPKQHSGAVYTGVPGDLRSSSLPPCSCKTVLVRRVFPMALPGKHLLSAASLQKPHAIS
jgi:hypothetical protein